MERIFIIITALLAAAGAWGRQMGLHFVENHVDATKGLVGQTWEVGVYDDNWIYFATRDGVLEHGRSGWRTYQMNNGHDVRSVFPAVDEGRVYLGGINEIGYITPGDDGRMRYVCLSDSIYQESRLGNFWGIYKIDNYLIGQGDYHVLKYDGQKATVIESDVKLDESTVIDGVVYFCTERGVKLLVGNNLITARDTEKLAGQRIRAIMKYGRELIIATASSGLYRHDGISLVPLTTSCDAELRTAEVFCGAIRGDKVALGTVADGLFLIDLARGETQHYNHLSGIQNETVLSLAFDNAGDLWVGMDSGIDQIKLTEPVMTLNSKILPVGSGYATHYKGNRFYAGTNRGLYYLDDRDRRGGVGGNFGGDYRAVEGLRGQVWDLVDIGGDLFCAHDRGLFIVDGEGVNRVGDISGVWTVVPMAADSTKAWIGAYDGILLMSRGADGKWAVEGRVGDFTDSSYDLVEERHGVVWANRNPLGALRVKVDPSRLSEREVTIYDTSRGLPTTKDIHIRKIGSTVYFATVDGVYQYDASRDTIVASDVINAAIGASGGVISLQGDNEAIFALTDNELIRLSPTGAFAVQRLPIMPAKAKPLRLSGKIDLVDDSTAIFPNYSGFTSFNFGNAVDAKSDIGRYGRINYFVLTTRGDSILYVDNILGRKPEIDLPYSDNSVKINYGVWDDPYNQARGYRYRLNRSEWSELTTSPVKEYTDLPEGDYVFEVEAVMANGDTASDSIEFTIRAPWYRSTMAYVVYCLLGIGVLCGAYVLERRRMRRKELSIAQAKDAELVSQREYYEELDELKKRQIADLEKEKLQGELEHKSQEITNLLMTVANKHEALIALKQEIKRISSGFSGTAADRQALLAIQSRIDSTIQSEGVMERIEKEFDIVHNNFIKRLKAEFPDLTRNEVLMCAYIKMNMSSKEIASLMNLSVRGIETMRYRMRKKFGLDREDSLSEFLLKFA